MNDDFINACWNARYPTVETNIIFIHQKIIKIAYDLLYENNKVSDFHFRIMLLLTKNLNEFYISSYLLKFAILRNDLRLLRYFFNPNKKYVSISNIIIKKPLTFIITSDLFNLALINMNKKACRFLMLTNAQTDTKTQLLAVATGKSKILQLKWNITNDQFNYLFFKNLHRFDLLEKIIKSNNIDLSFVMDRTIKDKNDDAFRFLIKYGIKEYQLEKIIKSDNINMFSSIYLQNKLDIFDLFKNCLINNSIQILNYLIIMEKSFFENEISQCIDLCINTFPFSEKILDLLIKEIGFDYKNVLQNNKNEINEIFKLNFSKLMINPEFLFHRHGFNILNFSTKPNLKDIEFLLK